VGAFASFTRFESDGCAFEVVFRDNCPGFFRGAGKGGLDAAGIDGG
jgi:hypothetical protein